MFQQRRRKILAATFAAVALAALTASASTGTAARAVTRTSAPASPPCHSSFNPYHYSRAAVAACGYRTFPREYSRALAGGGQGVYYSVNGHTVEFLIPPDGFNPATASAAQLNAYGFPPRPASKTARARWASEVAGSHAAPVPPFLAETHARADTVYNPNWSGYVASGGSGTFNSAQAYYTEPMFYSSSCATNSDVTWAGISGYYARSGESRDPLAQDGTGHGVPGLGNHQAWWELYPTNNITPVSGLFGHIGYTFDAFVQWHGAATYSFYMHDAESNTHAAFREHLDSYSGISAEAINERPTMADGTLTNLSNYRVVTFSNSQGNGKTLNSYPSASNYLANGRHGLWMENLSQTHIMAQPSPIHSGGQFTITQDHCS